MSAEEWEQIKRIFEAALNVPEAERTAFVNDLTEANTRLRQTVLELLRAHAQAEGPSEDTVSLTPSIGVFNEGQLVANRFRILRLLGRGGMGEVYEAFDEKLRTRIALKTLRPELVGDEDARRRFEREIRVSQQLTYDGLCRVYDLFEHQQGNDRIPCVTMQMLEGETLQKYLERMRPMEPGSALPLIRQIASALDFLHQRNIVHRDLKPSNIMLVPGEKGQLRIVVMDFGLAKPLNSQNDMFRSRVDFQAGAPFYMAPEVLRGEPPTIQSDIFAFGLIVDEMVTASRAYPVDSIHSLFFERLWGNPIPPSQRATNLPEHWNTAILRCLGSDPQKRPKCATDVVKEFEYLDTRGTSESRRWRIPEPARVLTRRSLVLAGIGAPVASAIWIARPVSTSVVVFPVENLTPNKEYDYLCKGTSAELMSRLLRVDGLRVIPFYEPRSKVNRFPSEARFAVSGYLQDFNNRLRLIMQLVDSRDGTLVWTGTFDRKTTDPLQLQLEIAQGTFQALETKVILGRAQKESLWGSIALQTRHAFGFQKASLQGRTESAEALDLYMRGRHELSERTVPTALRAIDLFKRALTVDPQFGLVYSAIADAQFVLMDNSYRPASDLILEARQNAERAIRIDPDLAEGHLSLAAVHQALWDWHPSEDSYAKALKAGPKLARAHRWYAGFVTQFGRFDEAIKHCRIALDLDPYDYPNHAGYGLYLFLARRYNEAVETLEETLRQKDLLVAHNALGDTYARIALDSPGPQAKELLTKAFQEAAVVAEKEASGGHSGSSEVLPRSDQMYALYYAVSGDSQKAGQYLDRLHAGVQTRKVSPIALAEAYSVLGRQRDALAMLKVALDERDRQVLYIGVSPFLDGIRKTDEFDSALKMLKL